MAYILMSLIQKTNKEKTTSRGILNISDQYLCKFIAFTSYICIVFTQCRIYIRFFVYLLVRIFYMSNTPPPSFNLLPSSLNIFLFYVECTCRYYPCGKYIFKIFCYIPQQAFNFNGNEPATLGFVFIYSQFLIVQEFRIYSRKFRVLSKKLRGNSRILQTTGLQMFISFVLVQSASLLDNGYVLLLFRLLSLMASEHVHKTSFCSFICNEITYAHL